MEHVRDVLRCLCSEDKNHRLVRSTVLWSQVYIVFQHVMEGHDYTLLPFVYLACCRIEKHTFAAFFFPYNIWVKHTRIMLQFFPNQFEDPIQKSRSHIDVYFFILCFLLIPYSLFSHLTGIRTEKNVFVFSVSSLFSVLSQISPKMFSSLLHGGIPSGCQVCGFLISIIFLSFGKLFVSAGEL